MSSDPDCVFCRIAAGEAPATVVHSDDTVVAFLDIDPVTPGHTLVVPRAHLPSLADLDERTGARMFEVARRLAAALRASGLRCEGVNLFLADGEAASQEVFHAHLHVFPRYGGDGFELRGRWGSNPTPEELEEAGARIRSALAATDADA
jgi:histidine triad (HIT) family protein